MIYYLKFFSVYPKYNLDIFCFKFFYPLLPLLFFSFNSLESSFFSKNSNKSYLLSTNFLKGINKFFKCLSTFLFSSSSNLGVLKGETDFFLLFFLVSLLENKLQKKVYLQCFKSSFVSFFNSNYYYTTFLDFLCDKFKKFQSRIGRGFFLREFFESVFFFFYK